MNTFLILVPILLPIVGGFLMQCFEKHSEKWKNTYMFCVVLATSIIVFGLLVYGWENHAFLVNDELYRPLELVAFHMTGSLTIAFKIDGLGMVFAGLVAFLWPLAVLYSFEYMEHDHRKKVFNMFYTITYGITIGMAFSGNLLTMYLFFELLTLVTTPLVIHDLTHEANRAGRKYLAYCIGGAAFGFIALIFMIIYGEGANFVYGGCLRPELFADRVPLMLTVYLFGFFGFGVKAAVFPFHGWLPSAYVAPTPVTALLHAVAVVKAGAFSVIRLTYYCYGAEFLKNTWAQKVAMGATIVTIVYASSMAVRQQHLKKRLAYSTVSNLSYILFGVTIMSPLGLVAALTHLMFHAIMKICSFFCAGAVMHKSGKCYVNEIEGMGKKMPKTFACFTVASFALVGTPPLCGFISKWNLGRAAFEMGGMAYIGLAALFLSALLVAIYMLSIVIKAYFPKEGVIVANTSDPGYRMLIPLFVFVVVIIVTGVHSAPFVQLFQMISKGLM